MLCCMDSFEECFISFLQELFCPSCLVDVKNTAYVFKAQINAAVRKGEE